MIQIKYQYPISGVADLEARLMLDDVAMSDWEPMAAYEIEEIHAGYEFEFPDTEADAVQFSSISQSLADEQELPSVVTVDNEAIAAAVRTNLAPELAKLDVPGTLANTENAELFKADVSELGGIIESSGLSAAQKDELLRAAGLIQTPVNPAVSLALDSGEIAFRRGDTFTRTLELATSAAGCDKLWMTFKKDATQPDAKAALQFIAGEGLKIVNGALTSATVTPFTAGDGEITLAGDGVTLTINLDESVTAQLSGGNAGAKWDVQILKSGIVTTIAEGTWKVAADVTRATE